MLYNSLKEKVERNVVGIHNKKPYIKLRNSKASTSVVLETYTKSLRFISKGHQNDWK